MKEPYFSDELSTKIAAIAGEDRIHGIKSKFKTDDERAATFSTEIASLYFDISKTHISKELLSCYEQAAEKNNLKSFRLAFLAGEKINSTEQRAVLHTLLRDSSNQGIAMRDPAVLEQAEHSKAQFETQFNAIDKALSARQTPVRNIIHVGIGGSSLGTQLVYEALKALGEKRTIHFIGNIDAHQLVDILDVCDPKSTIVVGVSKTFTTAETLQNLSSIAAWFREQGVEKPLKDFYGVTANPSAAYDYGLDEANVVTFPEWVGGRYSVWSSVSLSAAIVLGKEKFQEFLDGAAIVDKHFYATDFADNVCFQAAVLDHYYANFMGVSSKAIFAYDYRFRSLVDYLQQLETESNGKDRHRDGRAVNGKTSMVVWGGVGTDVQHSVFQMLHQGTAMIPSEFILVKKPDHAHAQHHNELLANGIAQTAALLEGQSLETVQEIHRDDGLGKLTEQSKIFSGDRPSMTILLDQLTPKALGSLLAFYEHRVFLGGALADINSFDQMGVELGKRLAKQVRPFIDDQVASDTGFDSSTERLLSKLF